MMESVIIVRVTVVRVIVMYTYLESRNVGIPGAEVLRVLGSHAGRGSIGSSKCDGNRNLVKVRVKDAYSLSVRYLQFLLTCRRFYQPN